MPGLSLGSHRALLAATLSLAILVGLFAAATSRAADGIYWNNYGASPASIGFSGLDGGGGGALNASPIELSSTEGMAYDTVTNRLFVANDSGDKIVAINLDGSGAAYFTAPGALIDSPEGVVVDPETRTVYWINANPETISWARLDGSAGGVVSTDGTDVDAYRLSLDPVAKRLYWFDGSLGTIASVSTGGGAVAQLNTAGATPGTSASGVAVEPGLGKVFWLNDNDKAVSWASLSGAGGGDIPVSESALNGAYGIAVDASLGRLYWANYSNSEKREAALGFLNLAGGDAPISVLTAPVDGPQDPVIIKSPAATVAPAITRGTGAASAQLSCSNGTWAGDAAGAFFYRAPRSYAYAWTLNGAPIAGATASTLTATAPGQYGCTVIATNQAGSTAASVTAAASVKAAKFKLVLKTKKAKAKVGKLATFKVQVVNQGDLASKKSQVCAKLTKAQKKALKQPKCKKLGQVAVGTPKTVKLKVKVKRGAKGTYRVKLVPKGTGGKAVQAKLQVVG